VTPLLFICAKTVSELDLFVLLGLLFERKQIPQIVVNIRIQRKAMEPLEATRLPWAQAPPLPSWPWVGIPGRLKRFYGGSRTAFRDGSEHHRSDAATSIVKASVRLHQERPVRSEAEEGMLLAEKDI
jgi:hypothetical protein